MTDFVFDFLFNYVGFRIGAISIRAITFGRIKPDIKESRFPFAIAFFGIAEIIGIAYLLFVLIRG